MKLMTDNRGSRNQTATHLVIFEIDGQPVNCAAHLWCNTKKGSLVSDPRPNMLLGHVPEFISRH